MRTKSNYLDIS